MIKKLKITLKIMKLIFTNKISYSDNFNEIVGFENKLKNYFSVKYVLSTNNGTSALHSAYYSLGLKKGDEVILPSYTWHSTLTPLINMGVKPIFAEINPDTLLLEADDVEKKITKKTKAIVVVHLWGNVCDMDKFLSLKHKYGVKIIEDASHAFGAEYGGKKIGSIGDIACFSLQASKAVSGGEAGILITDNKCFYKNALELGNLHRLKKEFGIESNQNTLDKGFKYSPHPLSIILAEYSFNNLNEKIKDSMRKLSYLNSIVMKYSELKLPTVFNNVKLGAIYGYRIIFMGDIKRKKEFIDFFMRNEKLKICPEFYPLLHKNKLFINTQLPISENVYEKIICVGF